MRGYIPAAGEVIASLRRERGLSQERLAERAKVSARTVQRAECGKRVRLDSIRCIADALGVDSARLQDGMSIGQMMEITDEFSCRHCGAPLIARTSVEHQYGEAEWDRFACGAESGWRDRPCPEDDRFPAFEDYEVVCYEDGDGFYCYAAGKTDAARAVELMSGYGKSRESARKWVERSYVLARFGSEAAEKFLPLSSFGT